MIKLESQNHARTLPEVFDLGLKLSRDKPFLGHRPLISTNPVKYADHYVWSTYAEVDERRRNVGSALHRFFAEGKLGGGDLATVGIWSQNRPGTLVPVVPRHKSYAVSLNVPSLWDQLFYRVAGDRHRIARLQHGRRQFI